MRTRKLWIVQLAALAGIGLWAMFDLQFESMSRSLTEIPGTLFLSNSQAVVAAGPFRLSLFVALLTTALVTLAALLIASVWPRSHRRHRSLASLLAITAVVALWLAIGANQRSLAWQGKRLRLAAKVSQFEALAEPLRDRWPRRDGEIAGVGPFMAYPFGKPSTLILLQSQRIVSDEISIVAVERGSTGAIRLQLSSNTHDDWAEWHPPESEPGSFLGGLGDRHEMQQSASLGSGWYLVRYGDSTKSYVSTVGNLPDDRHCFSSLRDEIIHIGAEFFGENGIRLRLSCVSGWLLTSCCIMIAMTNDLRGTARPLRWSDACNRLPG